MQRPINFRELFPRLVVFGANHKAIRVLEVTNGRSGTKKFRIGSDHDMQPRSQFLNDALYLIAGADRHCRFQNNECPILESAGNFPCCCVDI